MAMVTITPSGRFLSIPSRLSIYSTRISFSSLNAIHFQTGRTALPIRAGNNGPGSSGDEESKAILNAFFLGNAFAEVVNERVGTALGEFLSDVGRKQAEQQRQVREFQPSRAYGGLLVFVYPGFACIISGKKPASFPTCRCDYPSPEKM